MSEINIKIPPIFKDIFKPYRYKAFYGGRGSSKSWTIARFLIIQSLSKTCRILCTREYQSSITDSVYKLLSDSISNLGLNKYFIVNRSSITSCNGSEFIFAGLTQHIESIKSYE
jgi:phage terminase large subunit